MAIASNKVLIVMPALNEQASVADVVRETKATLPSATVVVVDDGSTDATAAVARAAGAIVLRLPVNLGVGAAMRLGFRFARINGFEAVVQIDADGQHDPASVPPMLEKLDEADVVIGARFAGVGTYSTRGPRRWAMVFLARTLSAVTRTKLTDATSGLRAAGPRAIEVFANHYPAEYLGDTVETLVIARRAGLIVRQVPAAMRPRAGGVPSQNPIRSAAYLIRAVLALLVALARPSRAFVTGQQ